MLIQKYFTLRSDEMKKLKNISDKAILVSIAEDDGSSRQEIVEPNGTVLVPDEKAGSLTDKYLSGEWGVVEFEEVEEG